MNENHILDIEVRAWSKRDKVELTLPKKYELIRCGFNGKDKKKATIQEIEKSISEPIDSERISERINENSEVAIVFDDLSRPTCYSEITPIIINELLKGGVKKENIRFICATGAHGALTLHDFVQKLGKQIVTKFPVYNHNPFWGNKLVGKTENNIPLYLNEELEKCDFIIGLGTVLPHVNMGFSGGSKLIFPGCCGIESIAKLHSIKCSEKIKLWNSHNNPQRIDINKAGKTCGLDFIVNVILNAKLEITDVFCGDSITAFNKASELAKEHYNSKLELDSDIVIVNMFSRENESFVGQLLGMQCLREKGGILIIIAESLLGQVTHYATGNFGKYLKNDHYVHLEKPSKIKKQIIFSSIPDKSSSDWWLEDNDKIIWATSWDEVLNIINEYYPSKAKITFIEDGGMQYDSRLNIEI